MYMMRQRGAEPVKAPPVGTVTDERLEPFDITAAEWAKLSPMDKVKRLFGSYADIADLTGRGLSTVYRWRQSPIPSGARDKIIAAARERGLPLSYEDLVA